jgi:hypothetical protein
MKKVNYKRILESFADGAKLYFRQSLNRINKKKAKSMQRKYDGQK